MRVCVLSDSHYFTGRLNTILMKTAAEGPIDALIHLGDGYDDLRALDTPLPPVYQVAGNCDLFRSDTRNIIELSGARLLLTHGHFQHVKNGTDELLETALEENCRAALYGHTHVQKMERRQGVLLLNPGAAASGRYAIMHIGPDGAVEAELRSL